MRKPALLLALALAAVSNAFAAITGTVIDPDGKPIAGATIRAYAAENSAALRARLLAGKIDREPLATAQSSESGAFSLDVKGATAVDVAVEATGRNRITTPSVDGDDLGAIALSPPPARTLHITGGGKAVANAIVLSGADLWRTNASGEVPVAATNAVFVVHPDYAMMRREIGSALEVKLTPGVAVRGRVVNAAGPVPHAIVSINGWPLAESGDDGTFVIAHAPESWQSITAARGNDVGMAARSKAASVEIRLSPGSSFTGMLRDTKRNAAVGGARMTLSGDDVSMTAVTDAKGNFTFAPLLPRAYQIAGMHPGFAVESANVTLPATKTRSFVAQQFALAKGRVIDEEKKPVGAAMVTATGNAGVRGRTSLTNAAGEFTVRIVPAPSALPVTAAKRDYVSGTSARRIWQAGETRNDVIITLAKGFVAQVKVIDKQRQPVPNAQVNVTRSTEGGGQRSAIVGCADPSKPDCHRTGADGIVSLRTTEGRHDVMVLGDDVAPVRSPNQPLTARAPQIVISVDRGVEISGRVVHADGTPVVGAIVDAPTPIMQRSATSAADGTFTIAGIASGSSVLTAHTADGNLTSALTVNAPARNVTITMPQGARIEGRITDRATQQPVTEFTILLPRRGSPRPNDFASTGSPIHADDGHYALENVTPGDIQITVHAAGYVAGTRSDINAEDGKTASNIDIQLDRGTTVSGHVTSGGAPVAGVQVRQGFQRTPTFSNVTTDADGFYSLDGVAEGDRTIEFQKMGYIVLHKPIAVTAGKDIRLDVELDHGRELRGRVVDRTGGGMAGVLVAASTPGQPGPGNTMTPTDGDGSFVMQGLADGKYNVTARKEGLVSAEAKDVDVPQIRALTLTMDAGATITGRVTGLPPEQLTQVIVTASGGTSRNQTYVDASGNFSLPGLPDGRVRLDAFLTGASNRRMAPTKTITIENGVAPPVEMNFEEGITVSGKVTKGGTAVSSGFIAFVPAVLPSSPGVQTANSMIAPDGTYTVPGLTAGNYSVRVSGAGVAYQTKYTVAGSGTFDIDIHGATLRGHVVDATSGAGLANARVNVVSRGSGSAQALTDSEGRFAIEALADAAFDLSVIREQYAAVKQQVVVSGGTVPDVEVRMEPAAAVTIHLLDVTTGAPLDGSVAITDPASKSFMGEAQRVDTGTFKAWLKAGTYQAGGFAPGYIFKAQSFTTPADVNLALVRGGTLLIRARTTQTVRLDRPAGATQRALGVLHPGQNGPYESIPPGSYILATVGSDGKVQSSVPVMINAGETASVDLP